VLGRTLEGLALIAWLGLNYLGALQLRRLWQRGGRAWLGRTDAVGSRWLASFARRRGALLIKIGQFVASRPDIFPLVYVDACSALRDQAPARPWPVVEAALALAYEGRAAERLPRIEHEPIAAASFGQVHRAWLGDGTLVAVKVQYPDLGGLVARDLWLARLALRIFALALPGWPTRQIYREIERTAQEEQDYLHEGLAADRLRAVVAPAGLSVPLVRWEHTREKVLVMEFAPGTTLARLDLATLPAAERRRIADALIDGFLAQLLEAGYFHADPHAGNLIYEPRPDAPARLWLIDFGMTAEISARDAGLYRRFLDRLHADDTDGMVDVLIQLGFVLPDADRARLKDLARELYTQLGQLDPQSFKGSRRQADLAAKINQFLRRMEGIVFPQHTLMLSRATSLIEGQCMELVPGVNIIDLIRPRLERIGWRQRLERLAEEVRETWQELRALPDRMEAALAARPAGGVGNGAVVAAVLLLAALQLPEGPWRIAAIAATGLAVLAGLRPRR
jgi:predicted unusual protein kinase regulating ubiquinone biosynthesis (AarF/ABC1/UbiB family)